MLNKTINKYLPVFLFVTTCLIYYLTSPGKSPYDYFNRLAQGFLNFRLYITESPSWLNELIPFDGKYYVALPPMPAIIMTPFVLLLGSNFSETAFSIVLAALSVVLGYFLFKKMGHSDQTSLFVATFFAFGTNLWFLSSVGSSWYLAHITALFFSLLALNEAFGKQRLLLIGFLMGAAFWARTSILFTMPFYFIFLWRKFWPIWEDKKLLNLILLNLGLIFFILIDAWYNFARFGEFNPFAPYKYIRNVDTDTVVNGVYMSINYIPKHIDALLFRLPKMVDHFPYLIPSLYATAIWFTSPLLIFMFRAKKSLLSYACLSAIIPTLFVVMMWAGVGFSQYGYRFIQDVMPFILILVASGIGQKPSRLAYALVLISILINAWGVILINKFNLYVI